MMTQLEKFEGILSDNQSLALLPAETSTNVELFEINSKSLLGLKQPYEKLLICTDPAKRTKQLELLQAKIQANPDYAGIIQSSFEAGWPLYNKNSSFANYLQLNVLELAYKQMKQEISAKYLSTNIAIKKPAPDKFLAYIPEMHCYEDAVAKGAPELAQIFEQLWPEAESAMLEHMIGRTLAGPDNTKPFGAEEFLYKGYRTICIAIGAPGIGKSALLDLLRETMDYCQYRTATYFDIESEFGTADMYLANFIAMDDSGKNGLTTFAHSSRIKGLASGAQFSANVKGKERIEGRCKATLLGAGNELNEFDIKAGDAGNLDRLVFCKSKDRPGRVLDYIDEQASRLGCCREVLMMASMRKALDKYLALPNNGRSSIELKAKYEAQLCYRLDSNRQLALIKAMMLATMLAGLPIEPCTKNNFLSAIVLLCKLASLGYGSATFEAKGLIRADYHAKGKPKSHAWSVFSEEISSDTLDLFLSHKSANDLWQEFSQGQMQSNATMSRLLLAITDANGIAYGAKIAPFKQAWAELNKNQAEIKSMQELIPEELLEQIKIELGRAVKARPANILKWANKND